MSLRSVPVRLRRRFASRPAAPAGSDVACHAPFTSMYLDPRGFVRACCMNDYQLLGNIADRSLLDIWRGPEAQELRRAMERHDLTVGCEFCKWQVDDGRADLAFARWFDDFPVAAAEPRWPVQLEMSISNACNLQCVMCNAEWSSSIRTQRDGLPPLPKVYDDRFFDDLGEFLPHLQRVKFLGGEPFLATETLRVMDMMVQRGLSTRCHVTTNGTQWSPRVERLLDMLPVDVAVSLDAATSTTYESIRIGSSWAAVQTNLDRFQDRAAANGTVVTVTCCLMTANWHEFADFCRAADERGIECAVNTVTEPAHLSIYQQPLDELRRIVEALEEEDRGSSESFGLSARTWSGELRRLRAHLDSRELSAPVIGLDQRKLNPEFPRPFGTDEHRPAVGDARLQHDPDESAVAALVGSRAHVLHLDDRGRVTSVDPATDVLGTPAEQLVGSTIDELSAVLGGTNGDIQTLDVVEVTPTHQVFEVQFASGRWVRSIVVGSTTGRAGGAGQIHISEIDGPGGRPKA